MGNATDRRIPLPQSSVVLTPRGTAERLGVNWPSSSVEEQQPSKLSVVGSSPTWVTMGVVRKTYPSQEELKELFDYRDGSLYWRQKTSGRRDISIPAGTTSKSTGYHTIHINGGLYKRNRLTWIWHNGAIPDEMLVDHINDKKADDRIENLQLLSHADNLRKGKSFKGVTWNKQHQAFRAYGRQHIDKGNGGQVHLGYHKTESEALEAVRLWEEEGIKPNRKKKTK